MLNWLFDWLNKFLEDNPSGEEQAFWNFFKENAVVVNRIHFVPESIFSEFNRENFKKISETLERKGYILLCLNGIYTTKKGEDILKKINPSKLPNTNTIGVSGSGRTTKKILTYGRITKKLPDDGRNTTKLK